MPLSLKFHNVPVILICLLNSLNGLNISEYPSSTIASFVAEIVTKYASKFDDFELTFSLLPFLKEKDPVPCTDRKEALILSAKNTVHLKSYLCAAFLFHLWNNLEAVASSAEYA